MWNLLVLVLAMEVSAQAAEIEWSGEASLRYLESRVDDGLGARNATTNQDTSNQLTRTEEFAGGLQALGTTKGMHWGAGIRMKGTSANNRFVRLNQNTDFTAGFEQLWFAWKDGEEEGHTHQVTVGRQRNVFHFETNSEQLFDQDVRFDGISAQCGGPRWGVNSGVFTLGALNQGVVGGSSYTKTDSTERGATTKSRLSRLFAIQPYGKFTLSDDISASLAVGYYHWANTGGFYTNTLHGGVDSASTGASTGSLGVGNQRQLQVHSAWALPYKLNPFVEWVHNKKVRYANSTVEAKRDAWVLGVGYGNVAKKRDFSATYFYGSKGLAAVVNALSSDVFLADNKGHSVRLAYGLLENLRVSARALLLKELSRRDANGVNLARQDHETTYWEIGAAVDL